MLNLGHVFKRKASQKLIKPLNKHTLHYCHLSGTDLCTGDVTVGERDCPCPQGVDILDERETDKIKRQSQKIITNAMNKIKLRKGIESDQKGRDKGRGWATLYKMSPEGLSEVFIPEQGPE